MAKVTIEEVKRNMEDVLCETRYEFDKPVTYVTVRMLNGFTVRESTTCVDPSNYSEEIGKQICLEKIENHIWNLLGYSLQEKQYQVEEQDRRMTEWKNAFEANHRFFTKTEPAKIKIPEWVTTFDASKIVVQPYGKTLKEIFDNLNKEQ